MRLIATCHRAILAAECLCAVALCGVIPAQASVTINFSAMLVEGTCDLSLDRTVLNLGNFPLISLTPSTLFGAQPFTLFVRDCTPGKADAVPVVTVSGYGVNRSGRWVFRNSASTSANLGVMLFKTNVSPSFSDEEMRSGTQFDLTGLDIGALPYEVRFYAGMSCGATCSDVTPGDVEATIAFEFRYL